jgi:DNA-binding transcriptional LysR family regulator
MNDLAPFAAVAEAKSFAAAARRLRLTTAGVSKAVIRLETRLGARLFTRTTRRVALTAEGAEFYARARDILDRLAEAEAEVGGGARGLRGHVRITAPVLIGQQVLAPMLAGFRSSHPAITLDVRLTDGFSGLVEEGIDLALRLGGLADSRLVARRLAATRFATCASPVYLARFGEPGSVDDLRAHSCVTYVVQGSGKPFAWRFAGDVRFEPERGVLVGDGGANRAFAVAGSGLIQEIDVAVGPDLKAGSLVEVLGHLAAPGPPLSLVQPAGRFVPGRVRAVGEHIAAAFAR